ncbi:GNAT family N-acetyltransferase [Ruoffia tabacinasalis]|uniref:GNAT family N-acetyltransferase n=1 Tax=Ruoffia tabacinasalis TaxID=87458 RepID=UPI0030CB4E3E
MSIRLAAQSDFDIIMDNYRVMTEYPGQVDAGAGWVLGIYPDETLIQEAINLKQYYVYELEDKICGGMIINEAYTEGYEKVSWQIQADEGEFISIHALGVMPNARGKGIAKALVQFAHAYGNEHNYKAIRIDVYGVNKAGKKLYPATGFVLVDTIELYYEDTGLAEYLMYEYII